MALMGIADRGQLGETMSRRFNLDSISSVGTLAPELMPTIVYEHDRPEWGVLKGEINYGSSVHVAVGTPLESGRFALKNPAGSGIIATIELAVAITWQMMFTVDFDGNLGTLLTEVRLDSRWSNGVVGRRPACSASHGTSDVLPTSGAGYFGFDAIDPRVILGPGGRFLAWVPDPGAIGDAYGASIRWRERVAMPEELLV